MILELCEISETKVTQPKDLMWVIKSLFTASQTDLCFFKIILEPKEANAAGVQGGTDNRGNAFWVTNLL